MLQKLQSNPSCCSKRQSFTRIRLSWLLRTRHSQGRITSQTSGLCHEDASHPFLPPQAREENDCAAWESTVKPLLLRQNLNKLQLTSYGLSRIQEGPCESHLLTMLQWHLKDQIQQEDRIKQRRILL